MAFSRTLIRVQATNEKCFTNCSKLLLSKHCPSYCPVTDSFIRPIRATRVCGWAVCISMETVRRTNPSRFKLTLSGTHSRTHMISTLRGALSSITNNAELHGRHAQIPDRTCWACQHIHSMYIKTHQPHFYVHANKHRLSTETWGGGPAHLIKVWVGFRFANAVEVLNVNELKVVGESGVRGLEFRQELNMRKVSQLLITPVVQVTQTVQTWEKMSVRRLKPAVSFVSLSGKFRLKSYDVIFK